MGKLILMTLIVFLSFVTNSNGQEIQFVTESYAPYQIEEEGKPLTGFAIELVESMKKIAKISSPIKTYPWARAYMMAQREPNTFIFTIARTKDREHLFHWIGNYYTGTDAFFALASRHDIVLNSIEDAKRYITAVPRGDSAAVRLENLGFNEEHLNYVIKQKQSIQMLHMGRVDLNSNNGLGFYTEIKNLGLRPNDFKKVFVISETNFGIAASLTTSEHLVQIMRHALIEVKANGTHARLIKKWFPGQE